MSAQREFQEVFLEWLNSLFSLRLESFAELADGRAIARLLIYLDRQAFASLDSHSISGHHNLDAESSRLLWASMDRLQVDFSRRVLGRGSHWPLADITVQDQDALFDMALSLTTLFMETRPHKLELSTRGLSRSSQTVFQKLMDVVESDNTDQKQSTDSRAEIFLLLERISDYESELKRLHDSLEIERHYVREQEMAIEIWQKKLSDQIEITQAVEEDNKNLTALMRIRTSSYSQEHVDDLKATYESRIGILNRDLDNMKRDLTIQQQTNKELQTKLQELEKSAKSRLDASSANQMSPRGAGDSSRRSEYLKKLSENIVNPLRTELEKVRREVLDRAKEVDSLKSVIRAKEAKERELETRISVFMAESKRQSEEGFLSATHPITLEFGNSGIDLETEILYSNKKSKRSSVRTIEPKQVQALPSACNQKDEAAQILYSVITEILAEKMIEKPAVPKSRAYANLSKYLQLAGN